jgi:hypothetical protein
MKLFLLILLFTFHANARSLIAFQGEIYTGDEVNSIAGNYGYGLNLATYSSDDRISFVLGGVLGYASAVGYIDSAEYDMAIYSTDIYLGFAFKPFKKAYLSPSIELCAMGGYKNIEVTNPPSGEDTNNLAITSGYKMTFAIDFGKQYRSKFRIYSDLNQRIAPKVSGQSNYNLSSISVGLGIMF